MGSIELSREETDEIFDNLPKHIKDKIIKRARAAHEDVPDSGIEILREFVKQYDENDSIERVMSFLCTCVLTRMIDGLCEARKQAEKSGERGISGEKVGRIALKSLEDEAAKIRRAFASVQSKSTH